MANRTRPLLLLALAPLLLAVGCTKDVVAPTPAAQKVGPDAEKVTLTMPSVAKTLYEVGPKGERTYGQNVLEGTATVAGKPATVQILGNVEYLGGSGPFYGFLTVKWADGASLGFSMQGQATKADDGTTSLGADLRFIGGSGRLADATAAAKFSGSRTAEVGSPITVTLTLDVVEPAK